MSTLEDLNAGPGGMAGFVSALSRRMRPVSRRDVLVGATVAATALATKPREYALTPVAAYATICGPGNTAASGWTVFCSTINKGVNTCPPGSFAAGWWKAADSSWCGGGYRYIVDCNASCSKCTTGCSDGMCDSRCWSCSCGTGSKASCDQRRVCCNAFRYGQCNTQLKCSGGVHCRVVSCVAPYQWSNCTTTSLVDNRTSEHSAPSLPAWGPIEQRYIAMGAQNSYLKASMGPVRVRRRRPRHLRHLPGRDDLPHRGDRGGAGDRQRQHLPGEPARACADHSATRPGPSRPGSSTAGGSSCSRAVRSPTAPARRSGRVRGCLHPVGRERSRGRPARLPHRRPVRAHRPRLGADLRARRHRRQQQHRAVGGRTDHDRRLERRGRSGRGAGLPAHGPGHRRPRFAPGLPGRRAVAARHRARSDGSTGRCSRPGRRPVAAPAPTAIP